MVGITLGSVPVTGVYAKGRLATGVYVGSQRVWPLADLGAFPIGVGTFQFQPRGLLAENGHSIRVATSPLAFAGRRLAVAIGNAFEADIEPGALQLHAAVAAVSGGAAPALHAGALAFDARALAVVSGHAIAAGAGALQFTPQAFTVGTASGITVSVIPGSLQITPQTLAPMLGTAFSADMAAAALQFVTRALAVSAGTAATADMGAGTIEFSGAVPAVAAGQTAAPAMAAGAVTFNGAQLAVSNGRAASSALSPGAIAFTGAALSEGVGCSVALGAGALVLTPKALESVAGATSDKPTFVREWSVPNDGTTTTITVNFEDENGDPQTPTAGNLLVATAVIGNYFIGVGDAVAPDGWTLIDHKYPPTYDGNLFVRISDGTETSVTFTGSGTLGGCARVSEWAHAKAGTTQSGSASDEGAVEFGPTGAPVSAQAVPIAFPIQKMDGSQSISVSSPWTGDMDNGAAEFQIGFYQQPAPDASVSGTLTIAPWTLGAVQAMWFTLWLEPLTPAIELDYTFPDATIGGDYNASISAWNVDGATGEITLTVTGLQSGWSVGTRTGSGTEADPYVWPVTGTTGGDPGTASVHIVADNGNGQTATADVDVTVNAASSGTAPSVAAHNATVLSGATIDFTIRKPATGNVWMLFVQGAKGTTVTVPAGQTWTQKDAGDSGGPTTQTWWHVVDGSETADPSFGADNNASGLLVELQDANTSNPFHNFARNNITGLAANTAYNLPSLTPTIANTLAIGTVGTFSQSGSVMTPATGWTTLDWSTLSAERIAGIYQVQDGSLAAVTGSLSYNNSGSGKGAAVLALIAPK